MKREKLSKNKKTNNKNTTFESKKISVMPEIFYSKQNRGTRNW